MNQFLLWHVWNIWFNIYLYYLVATRAPETLLGRFRKRYTWMMKDSCGRFPAGGDFTAES